jgi:hypothetical protein
LSDVKGMQQNRRVEMKIVKWFSFNT